MESDLKEIIEKNISDDTKIIHTEGGNTYRGDSAKMCEECNSAYPADNAKLCDSCKKNLHNQSAQEFYIADIGKRIQDSKELLAQKNNELQKAKEMSKQSGSQLKDFEDCANRRKIKCEKKMKVTSDIEAANYELVLAIDKYQALLIEKTEAAEAILEDIWRITREHRECTEKIKEFSKMINEQAEENIKLESYIAEAREEFEEQKKEAEIRSLDESELKKRVKLLQKNIEIVKMDNQSLEQHLKVLNEEQKLKSGTISIISANSSMILTGISDPKEQKSNELSLQMSSQLAEIMQLYQQINQLKEISKKANAKKNIDVTNEKCKCIIQ